MTTAPNNPFDSNAVPLGLLRRYLIANHWRRVDAPKTPQIPMHLQKLAASMVGVRGGGGRNFDLYVLSTEGLDDIELVVPRGKNDSDFTMRMESAVGTLCALTGLQMPEMVSEIRAIGFDMVQSRVPNNLVLDDSVQLEVAANYIDDIRELLTATATTEIQPSPFYQRAVPDAVKYADNCRFGHTFRGSFGFTIESPIEENLSPPLPFMEAEPPFERRVIQRLARGVMAACKAVDTGDIRPLVESVSTGFGANAWEKFAKLIKDTSPGGLTMSFSFSPELKPDPEIAANAEYVVDRRHIEVSLSAAKAMRETPAARPETIVGSISDLHSDDPENLMDSTSGRRITVRWFNGTREVNVLIPLDPDDYKRATDAHITGRQIRARGTLEQQGRTLTLRYVVNLTIVEPVP